MILTCLENYRENLIQDKDYLVIEIYTNIRTQKISYRICDEQGALAIYDSALFQIKEPSLNHYSMKIHNLNTQIMFDEILELDKASLNTEKVWGDYFDKDEIIINKVHQIIKEHAEVEGIVIPEPTAY